MFFKQLGEYFAKHPFFLGMLIFGLVALIAVIVVMVIVSKKRKANSATAERIAEKEAKVAEEQRIEQARVEEEEKRASHEAIWAKLDADFDKFSAEETKAKKKSIAKKVSATKPEPVAEEPKKAEPVTEELAVAEEPKKAEPKAKKKAPAKKAEPAVVAEEPKKKTPAKKAEPAVVAEEPKKKAPAKKAEPTVVAEEPKKKAPAKKAEPAVVAEEPKKKAPAKKAEPEVVADAEDETAVIARYAGKWVIYHVLTDANNPEDEMYFFELHASNGEKLFASEEYTSYNGAVKGIDTYKNNIAKDNFKISTTKKGDYIFKIMSGKNTLLCNGENYATKVRCESAMKSTKRFARTAIVDENVRDLVIPVPTETDTEIAPLPEGLTGKWLISSRDIEDEKVYFFELFANNGEKLLSSEEYTTYIGAVNGIQTHKQNIAKGNFRISLTKNGDYIYKLLNGNNQLLCLGEHYKTKARCESAVESVKRFAENSPTLTESDHVEE